MMNCKAPFFKRLEQLGVYHFHFPYRIGEAIDFATHLPQAEFQLFKQMLDRALIEGDGKGYSLVVFCDGLPQVDFELYGMRFRSEGNAAFRVRPLFVFLQAYPIRQ